MELGKFTMNEKDLPFIAYTIGVYLSKNDEKFNNDSTDEMWNTKVLPWAKEFYESKESFLAQQSWMGTLVKWIDEKLESERQKVFNVPIEITVQTTIPVLASDINQAHKYIGYNLEDILKNLDEAKIDWDYNGQEEVIDKGNWTPHIDVLCEEGWRGLY